MAPSDSLVRVVKIFSLGARGEGSHTRYLEMHAPFRCLMWGGSVRTSVYHICLASFTDRVYRVHTCRKASVGTAKHLFRIVIISKADEHRCGFQELSLLW